MDIDISKENIQPLRGGRNLVQLETALQAQSDVDAQRQLQIQKEEHEAAIKNYTGPDPLDPWFNYIQWVEQCYPKHGHEGHIDKLIKDCLQIFDKEERYFQDRRFVKLWIKYIDCLTNPLEIYQKLHSSGVGVEVSEFYRAWACYCEESGDFKKANQVYMLGLQARAQPLDELEQAHMNFQLYFAQRMLHDDSPTKRKAASALAETRLALTSLKPFKRRNIANAPIQRTGESVRSIVPGTVRQLPGANNENRPHKSNVMVSVFEDGPSTSHEKTPAETLCTGQGPASLVQAFSNVENEREVGVWTNAKTKMVHDNVVPHRDLPFTPYEDEDILLSANHMPYCLDDLEFSVPLTVPDPPDPTKIPCYNKNEVYTNNTEYSLEEIKSRKYVAAKANRAKSVANTITQPFTSKAQKLVETSSSCSALETLANCALDGDNDYGQLTPLAIPAIQNITKVQNIHSPGEPKILVNLDSKEFSELQNPAKKNDEVERPRQFGEMVDSAKGNLAEEFNRSLMSNIHQNVTVHTKEARWELRNLFSGNVNDTNSDPTIIQPIIAPFDMQKFDIHEDKSVTIAINSKKKMTPDAIEHILDNMPQDKENAQMIYASPTPVIPQTQVNKSAYFDEPMCTQVFNVNVHLSSTPKTSQFKKPSYSDLPNKTPNVPKFPMEDENMERREERPEAQEQGNADAQRNGLSVIMESTRENYSKSGSSSSGHQSTRTPLTGYTTRDSQAMGTHTSNLNYDSMYAMQQEPSTSQRKSTGQPRLPNGKFAKVYPNKANEKAPFPTDNQYQKPVQNFNGYAQRTMQQQGFQHNYSSQQIYQSPQGYSNQQNYATVQPGYPSPQASYHSPQHPGMQSPQQVQSPGFQSPQHVQSPHIQSPSPGYQSPHHLPSPNPGFQSPPHNYVYQSPQVQSNIQSAQQSFSMNSQEYQVPNEYQQSRPSYQTQASYQSPPHQTSYNYQLQRNHYQSPSYQHNYVAEYQQNYSNTNYQNQCQQNSFNRQSKSVDQNYSSTSYTNSGQQNQAQFQIYQSPNQSLQYQQQQHQAQQHQAQQQQVQQQQVQQQQHVQQQHQAQEQQKQAQQQQAQQQYRQTPQQQQHQHQTQQQPQHETHQLQYQPQQQQAQQPHHQLHQQYSYQTQQHHQIHQSPQPMQTSPEQIKKFDRSGNHTPEVQSEIKTSSLLRNIRHEQHIKTPDTGFSNQFLNFLSGRNEPKDNANTPKFTNSPTISQKMNKNLYVSSPEQAQMPPSSGQSDDGKESLTASINTPSHVEKTKSQSDKQKDLSKRQLDFDNRMEVQSEDSRDSLSKDGRISAVTSRPSMHSDGYMDMDENSMEIGAYKSMHNVSEIETSEIERPADIDFPEVIDPFSKKMIKKLLNYVQFPNKTHASGYNEVRHIPKILLGAVVHVGNNKYSIDKQLGKGNYGAVFQCLELVSGKAVAVKYQKPSRPWEFYICQEIKARIKDPFMLGGYMDITTAFIGDNASLFESELSSFGSLLDVANKVRIATSKCMNESIVLQFTSEMLSIVHHLHKAQIIHADIKPDNFLLMRIPTQVWRTPSLQLIDMGCSIDMSLFPKGTTFTELITTEGFTCTEMREGKPWTYQTDLYCLAGTIHVILFGSYMKVVNKMGQWTIDRKFARYQKSGLWDKVFTTLLNVPECSAQPDLMDLKAEVDEIVSKVDTLGSILRNFANVLKSR